MIQEIRGYVPSETYQLEQKAKRLKLRATELAQDISEYLQQQELSDIKLSTFISDLKFLHTECDKIQLEGISYSEDNVGISPQIVTEVLITLQTALNKEQEKKNQKLLTPKHR